MILIDNGEWIIDNDFVVHFLMLVAYSNSFISKVSDLFSRL